MQIVELILLEMIENALKEFFQMGLFLLFLLRPTEDHEMVKQSYVSKPGIFTFARVHFQKYS